MFSSLILAFAVGTVAHAFGSNVRVTPSDTSLNGEPSGFQTLRLPEYPHHSIRIKEQHDDVCDAGSMQFTGWLDVGGRHLFFWYFDSRSDSYKDPFVVWLNGGPGASSLLGMFMELGPCLINKDGTGTYRNQHAWTSNASMIFIDQPVGVGFSYADEVVESLPGDSFTAAADLVVFMRILYEAFPRLKEVDFHISGESYGGHYEPAWASEIVKYNSQQESSDTTIPLKSVLIGNGYVDPFSSTWGFYDTLCTTKPGVDQPVFNETRCELMAEAMPRCEYLSGACTSFPDHVVCNATETWCEKNILNFYMDEIKEGGRNPYDITAICDWDGLCYGAGMAVQDYLNSPSVWKALEVPSEVKNYTMLSQQVWTRFDKGVDGPRSMVPEVKLLLESGVDVLIYNGNLDLVCNTWGNIRWTERMPWVGQMEFASKPMVSWYANKGGESVVAGKFKEVKGGKLAKATGKKTGRFSFVTVDMAGHLVPMDQPEVALQLVQTWLQGGDFEALSSIDTTNMSLENQVVMSEL